MPRDQTDLRILDALERNARLTHAELAAQINLSRNALRARIERLEREGAIAAYTIRRGAARDQAGLMVALIFVYRQDRLRGAEVLHALRRIPEIVSCDVMSGEFDIVLRLEASAADRIRAIWQEIAAMPGVQNTLTSFALSPFRRA
jgi:DNA-binding Lrp family transcriptional regulator